MWSVPAALLYGLYNRYSSYLGRLYVGARFKKTRFFSSTVLGQGCCSSRVGSVTCSFDGLTGGGVTDS